MAEKFDKFTDRARKVLTLAQEEAQRFNHNYIGTEHLLLGLVHEGDGLAAQVLANMGVQLPKVRSAVEYIIGRGETMVATEIGLTPRAKKVIDLAVDEARRLNHHYIGTEHLLLGLVREGEGIAAGVLESLGVNLENVRTQVMQVVDPGYSREQKTNRTRQMEIEEAERIKLLRSERITVGMRALGDEPSAYDLLGFKEYAKALSDFIRTKDDSAPLVIGIDAEWGMGKSSLMSMIRLELNRRMTSTIIGEETKPNGHVGSMTKPWPTVWFNAWKYQDEESLWAALALNILSDLRDKLTIKKRFALWWELSKNKASTNLVWLNLAKPLIYALFSLVFLFMLVEGSLQLFWRQSPVAQMQEFIGDNLKGTAFTFVGFVGTAFLGIIWRTGIGGTTTVVGREVGEFISSTNYAQRAGFLARFQSDFDLIVRFATDNGEHPLVVFIDDLDRCSPPKTVDIIEAINLLLDSKHCVFVIGMDMGIVARSISAQYSEIRDLGPDAQPEQLGRDFLEKIVQLSFRVPQANTDNAAMFSRALLHASVSHTGALSQREGLAAIQAGEKIDSLNHEGYSPEQALENAEKQNPDIDESILQEAGQEAFVRSFEEHTAVQEAIQLCIPFLNANPRQIKRFLNLFRLYAFVANRRGILKNGEELLIPLARFVLILLRWPFALNRLPERTMLIQRYIDDSQSIEGSQQASYTYRNVPKDPKSNTSPLISTLASKSEGKGTEISYSSQLLHFLGSLSQTEAAAILSLIEAMGLDNLVVGNSSDDSEHRLG